MFRRLFGFIGNILLFIVELFLTLLFKLRYALTILMACLLAFEAAEVATVVLGPNFIPFGIVAICILFCYVMHDLFDFFQQNRREQLAQLAHPRLSEPSYDDVYSFPNENLPTPILNSFHQGLNPYTNPTFDLDHIVDLRPEGLSMNR